MLVPLAAGTPPSVSFEVSAEQTGAMRVELRRSWKSGNFTPQELLEALEIPFSEGQSRVTARFAMPVAKDGYHFIKLCENPSVQVRLSDTRLTGVLAVTTAFNKAVAKSSVQEPPADIGIDRFEFWLPKRRPDGLNLALTFEPPFDQFRPANVIGGPSRPVDVPNAWGADPTDPSPELLLTWPQSISLGSSIIEFDPDWDHPMESVPFLVRDFDLLDEAGRTLLEIRKNHSARYVHAFKSAVTLSQLHLRIHATHDAPAAVFRVRVFA